MVNFSRIPQDVVHKLNLIANTPDRSGNDWRREFEDKKLQGGKFPSSKNAGWDQFLTYVEGGYRDYGGVRDLPGKSNDQEVDDQGVDEKVEDQPPPLEAPPPVGQTDTGFTDDFMAAFDEYLAVQVPPVQPQPKQGGKKKKQKRKVVKSEQLEEDNTYVQPDLSSTITAQYPEAKETNPSWDPLQIPKQPSLFNTNRLMGRNLLRPNLKLFGSAHPYVQAHRVSQVLRNKDDSVKVRKANEKKAHMTIPYELTTDIKPFIDQELHLYSPLKLKVI